MTTHHVTTEDALDALYGAPVPASVDKELDHISEHYKRFIEAAPFCVVATVGPEGLDCSPRGDPAPIMTVVDKKTLLLPDRRGNGRIDSLRNLVRDPRISLLFLIPGVDVTIRINGRAVINADPDLCERFAMRGKSPKTVIVTTVDRVYFQCAKAIVRSRLWHDEARIDRKTLPTVGEMLTQATKGAFDGETYDANYPQRLKETIY